MVRPWQDPPGKATCLHLRPGCQFLELSGGRKEGGGQHEGTREGEGDQTAMHWGNLLPTY
eukprot:1847374-Pyramimonas_sp.AAC.1